jgi:hypothetical protein
VRLDDLIAIIDGDMRIDAVVILDALFALVPHDVVLHESRVLHVADAIEHALAAVGLVHFHDRAILGGDDGGMEAGIVLDVSEEPGDFLITGIPEGQDP